MIPKKIKRRYWFYQKELDFSKREGCFENLEKTHLSQRSYNGMRKWLEDPQWTAILHDKIKFKDYCGQKRLPVPKTYGFLHPTRGRTADKVPMKNAADLFHWIRKNDIQDFVLKHIGSGAGKHVFVVVNSEKKAELPVFRTIGGAQITGAELDHLLKEVYAGLQGYIVEEKLALHDKLQAITVGGLSSLRAYTFLDQQGIPHIQGAYLGIGRSGEPTDHSSNGGLITPIDLQSGKLKKARITTGSSYEWVLDHPDTGQVLGGLEVPCWKEVKELVANAAQAFPGIRGIGWDVVLSDRGPVILEGNIGNNLISLQSLFGGFIENGFLQQWETIPKVKRPDGSFRWRLRHLKGKGAFQKIKREVRLQIFGG